MRLRRVKAAIGSVLAAVTLLSMSLTGVTAAQASDDNLALNQTVTASSYEVATTAPEKAVDGDLGTRWGTAQNKAANEWIEVGLGGTKTVKQINIDFERKDADQNITSFKVELKQGDTYTKVYQKDTRAKQQEIILLDQAQQASAVKVTVLSADGGTMNWVNVGINEISVYSAPKETVLDTADTNHMLGATMTASSNETATLTPDKAIDQNRTGRNNRWASGYETPSNIWLKAEFPRLTAVKDIRIYFFERDVNPKPTNVQSFDLSYTDSEGTEHTLKSGYAMTASGAGYVADVVIQLDQAVNARSLKLSNFAIKSSEYNNVSVAEWEAYSNDQAEPGATLDSVVSDLESNHLTIETDTDTLALPLCPTATPSSSTAPTTSSSSPPTAPSTTRWSTRPCRSPTSSPTPPPATPRRPPTSPTSSKAPTSSRKATTPSRPSSRNRRMAFDQCRQAGGLRRDEGRLRR